MAAQRACLSRCGDTQWLVADWRAERTMVACCAQCVRCSLGGGAVGAARRRACSRLRRSAMGRTALLGGWLRHPAPARFKIIRKLDAGPTVTGLGSQLGGSSQPERPREAAKGRKITSSMRYHFSRPPAGAGPRLASHLPHLALRCPRKGDAMHVHACNGKKRQTFVASGLLGKIPS